MSTIASLNVLLSADKSPMAKTFKAAENDAQGFSSSMGGIGAGIKGLMSTALGPIGLVVGGLFAIKEAMSAATEGNQEAKKLDAVLTATGGAAGLTSDEIQNFAGDLQNLTNFEGDATVGAAAVMATFKEIKGDMFKDALMAAQDMSAVLGNDLQGSVTQVSKALNDPTKGITALSRAGVSFTEQQKQQIKTLQQSGDMVGAQSIIMKELQSEFGGAAKAMADPATIFQNNLGDMVESFGSILLPIRDTLISIAAPIVSGVTSVFSSIVPIATAAFGWLNSAIQSGINFIITTAAPYWNAFTEGVSAAFWGIVDFMAPIWVSVVGVISAAGNAILEIGMAIWSGLSASFSALAGLVGSALGAVGVNMQSTVSFGTWMVEALQAGLLVLEFAWTHWKDLASLALLSVGLGIVTFANTAVHWITVALPGYLSWFSNHWYEVFTDLVNITATVFTNIGKNLGSLWDALVIFFSGNGFNFEWTPLTEGFRSAITELPNIAAREMGPLEAELSNEVAALSQQIGQDFDAFAAERTQEIRQDTAGFRAQAALGIDGFLPPEQAAAAIAPQPGQQLAAVGGEAGKNMGALVKGSAEAFKAAYGGDNPMNKLNTTAEKQLAAQGKTNQHLQKIAEQEDEVVDKP